ncbi:MAG: non-hydrolyzing UDP-N-acetylglucosamine 2-epimerase [Vulcanimicrobiaceae bacterium]
MRIVSIVGARPEFVQAAVLSRALRERHHEILVHTGQHYDDLMSDVFFRDLGLPEADVNLGIGSSTLWGTVGSLLARLGDELQRIDPDLVVVRGDTSSTIAGALAARQTNYPLAHIEAGMRSFDLTMPEETNRVVADHLADLLFVTDEATAHRLADEGIRDRVFVVGDVMYDTYLETVAGLDGAAPAIGLAPRSYDLLTIHRQENTDERAVLTRLISAFAEAPRPVVFPVHPRTRARIAEFDIVVPPALRCVEPFGYREMIQMERDAHRIYTDSGGVQREAYFGGVECVTLRERTEWTNTIDAGWNRLVGSSVDAIRATFSEAPRTAGPRPPIFGSGDAARRICAALETPAALDAIAGARQLREIRRPKVRSQG